jgi:hypothetical protein
MLLLWGALFGLLTGLGTWVMRRVGVDAPDNAPTALLYLSRFWVGYAPCIALLQLVHLVTPINALVTAAVLCLCAVVSLSRAVEAWRRRAAHAEATPRWVWWAWLGAMLCIAFWLANRALSPQLDFDTGFYHLSAIRWLNEFPLVPGLANLHYRLGFNQSSFLLSALLNGCSASRQQRRSRGWSRCAVCCSFRCVWCVARRNATQQTSLALPLT